MAYDAGDRGSLQHDASSNELASLPRELLGTVVEILGCTSGCPGRPLSVTSQLFRDVCASPRASAQHDTYRCKFSSRRIALPLPDIAVCPEEAVAPMAYSVAWWRAARELCSNPVSSAMLPDRAVLCPHPGCNHEERSVAAAERHATACPVARAENFRGFRYAAPADIRRVQRRLSTCSSADVILDMDLGGRAQCQQHRGGCSAARELLGALRSCACKVDSVRHALVITSEEGTTTRLRLDPSAAVHRGWLMDEALRADCVQGAFPRHLTLQEVFATIQRFDEHDAWFDDGYTILAAFGWCVTTERRILSDEAWQRSLVVCLKAQPNGPKAQLRSEQLRAHRAGTYDRAKLFVPGVVHKTCPIAGDTWRNVLAEHVREAMNSKEGLAARKQALLESVIQKPCCMHAVSEQEICSEHAHASCSYVFLTFTSQEAAATFAIGLEATASSAIAAADGHDDLDVGSKLRSPLAALGVADGACARPCAEASDGGGSGNFVGGCCEADRKRKDNELG